MTEDGSLSYCAREAVGVFPDADSLEAAVQTLKGAGFDRAAISVLANDRAVIERIGHPYRSTSEAADDPEAPQATFVSRVSRTEGAAAAVGVPFQIGGFAGAAAVVAADGTLAAAIAMTILGGAVGAGLGALLALAVARQHAKTVKRQLEQGGLVLWVTTPDTESEARALAALRKCGATSVHLHAIERKYGPKDHPLADAQLDPLLLERDPGSSRGK